MDDDQPVDDRSSQRRSGAHYRVRTWLTPLAACVLVAAVAAVAVIAVRHHPAKSGAAPAPPSASASVPSSPAYDLTPAPTQVDATPSAVATIRPLPSPSGPAPRAPDGVYLCQGATGSALCADGTGKPVRDLPGNVGPDDVSFGSPVASPDGRLLAYGQMTLSFTPPNPPNPPNPPAPNPPESSQPVTGPHQPNRVVQIVVRDLRDLAAPPVIVPANLVSIDIAAGPLLGWSADSRQLFLVGPSGTSGTGGSVQALAISPDGAASGISTVFDPATVAPGCQVTRTMRAASGDFYVAASCASAIEVLRVHGTSVQPYGALEHTTGWTIGDAQLDTTGTVVELDWGAPPQSPQCVDVGGLAHIVGGVPIIDDFGITPGCIVHAPAEPAMPDPPPAASQ